MLTEFQSYEQTCIAARMKFPGDHGLKTFIMNNEFFVVYSAAMNMHEALSIVVAITIPTYARSEMTRVINLSREPVCARARARACVCARNHL